MTQIVHARFNPFADFEPAVSYQVEDGRTVAEIVAAAPGVPDWFWVTGEVRINGRRVARAQWVFMRPKLSRPDRPIIITLHAVYHGGGGGGSTKQIATTVAAIALIAGATLVSGGLLGPVSAGGIGTGLLGASFAAGGIGANLVAAGLGIAASLLLTTLTPPAPSGQDQNNRQISNAGISQNPIKPMAPLPVALGRVRASPPLIAPPYTTLENGVVYVHAIYGMGGYYDIPTAEILLNAVPIDDFDEVEYQIRPGSPIDAVLTICNETIIERRNSNAVLTNFVTGAKQNSSAILVHQSNPDQDLPQWQVLKSAGVADEIRLRMFWPGGLQAGGTTPSLSMVPLRVEIRRRGTATWLKLPVTHVRAFRLNDQIRKEIRLKFEAPPSVPVNEDSERHFFGIYAVTSPGQTWEYRAEAYFQGGSVIPVMTGPTTGGVTMSASDDNGGAAPAYLAANSSNDAISGDFWRTANGVTNAWLEIDLGQPLAIQGYFITCDFDAQSASPDAFTFEGFNGSTWDVINAESGLPAFNGHSDTFVNATKYQRYRFNLTATNGASHYRIVHIQLFQDAALPSNELLARAVEIIDDGVNIYLDPDVFPKDEYEVRIKRGFASNHSDFNGATYFSEGNAANAAFFDYYNAGGPEPWRIRKNQGTFTSETLLESITTRAVDYPFGPLIHTKGVAMIAVRAPSVNLESLSAIFHSIVPVWAGGTWSTDAPSSNPGALGRHVLLSTEQNAEALAGEIINEEAFQEFYEFCVTQGHEFNGVVDGLSVIDVFRQVLAAGFAAPDWPGLWSVIWEHDRSGDTPVQLFTPLDTRGLTVSKSFPRLPHALRPIFFDEDDDFNVNEASLVYMDGYDASNATRIEEMNYPGFTDAAKVAARALFDLRTMYLRPTRYTFEIGLAGLACQRGDLVMLIHDVISRYAGFARIASIQKSGGDITGLTLEATVDLAVAVGEVEETMAAGIQFADRTTGTYAVNEKSETDTITFVTPFADPGDILAEGMTVGFGPVGSETKRMLVLWYEYVDELTRRITLIDEAPGLHA